MLQTNDTIRPTCSSHWKALVRCDTHTHPFRYLFVYIVAIIFDYGYLMFMYCGMKHYIPQLGGVTSNAHTLLQLSSIFLYPRLDIVISSAIWQSRMYRDVKGDRASAGCYTCRVGALAPLSGVYLEPGYGFAELTCTYI